MAALMSFTAWNTGAADKTGRKKQNKAGSPVGLLDKRQQPEPTCAMDA
jgi:hypothetical protein